MTQHQVVTRDQWLAARTALLAKEKDFTRLRDRLSAERRALPWIKVEKEYFFDGPDGRETLADLFGGRSQLIVKHFMLGPGWGEGCVGCSFEVDHVDGVLVHLAQRDVGYVAVSRAPLSEIEPFRKRMGWHLKWMSSYENDFNYDFGVSFTPEQIAAGDACYNYASGKVPIDEMSGRSVFYRDANGDVFHTYSSYGRGGEDFLGTYRLLDIVPKGRDETGPRGNLSDWVRHHDRYGAAGAVAPTGRWVREAAEPCCASGE
ncbi:MAG TPA: thioredoxin family protein [Stellaceae bacterium]|nr:thioredoxin family protein [Stellaceae bacterium]